MGKLYLCVAGVIALCLSCQTSAAVVNFDDLNERKEISGSNRYDIFWESGNQGDLSQTGSWYVPNNPSDPDHDYYNFPYSDSRNITNRWGSTEIGFQFPAAYFEYGAVVAGAYFSVHGFLGDWAQAVMAKGYKDDMQIWETPLMNLTTNPQWLAMGELAVDRVVIFTTPKDGKTYGGFGMDDLTFDKAILPEPMTLLVLGLGAAFIRRRK